MTLAGGKNMDNNHCLPKNSTAFICAQCGAVGLDPDKLCKIQGQGIKADWCGIPHINALRTCKGNSCHIRYQCETCKQVSTDSQLLCNPVEIKCD